MRASILGDFFTIIKREHHIRPARAQENSIRNNLSVLFVKLFDSFAKGMAKPTAQQRKGDGLPGANERTPKAFEVSRVTTFERPDVLLLLGLAVVTFGIYAQSIGHRFT